MMTRKERRAAAHAARKAARKAGFPTLPPTAPPSANSNPGTDSLPLDDDFPCTPGAPCCHPDCPTCAASFANEAEEAPVAAPPPSPPPKPAISEARLAANRANSKLSTGPTSAAGLAKVSSNAVKTALTGRTVLLPFDDKEAYQALLASYQKEFQPVGPIETGLVQSLVDTAWRLERIPGLEYALVEMGHNKLGHENPAVALNTPQSALELHIRLFHEKAFRNLHLQENRLVRRRDREMKELRALQSARKAQEEADLKQAAQVALVAEQKGQPFHLEDLGFEFSTPHFTSYMARLTPAMKKNLLKEAVAA